MENEKNGEFQLPFKVEEIVGENIKHKIHKKPLLNAENMVLRGKYKSALEIYTRTLSRFSEPEIKEKLQANIRELQTFLGLQSPELEQNKKITIEPQKDFSSALKELTEDLTTSLTEGLNKLEKVEDELPEKPTIEEKTEEPKVNPVPIFIPTSTVNLENKDSSSLTLEYPSLGKSETDKALSPETPGVVILPTTPPSLEQKASSQKLDLNFETPALEKQEAKQKDETNLNLGLPTGLPAGEWIQRPPSENLGFTPKTEPKQKDETNLNLGLPTGLPEGEWIQKPPSENLGFTPKTDLTSLPVLEILNELYHSPDWGPFKNLPIKDRRSGEERRKEKKTVSKERRSGIERRKVDLFKQREEFLKNWSANFLLRQTQTSVSSGEAISSEVSSLSESSTFSHSDFRILGELPESMSHIDFVPVNLPNPTDKQQIHEKEKIIDQNTVSKSVESPSLPESTRESIPYSIANEEIIREISREINLVKIDLPDPITMRYEGFEDAPKRNISWEPLPEGGFKEVVDTAEPIKLTTEKVLYPTLRDETIHQLFKIDLPDPIDTTSDKKDDLFGTPGRLPTQVEDTTPPDIEIVESNTPPPEETQGLEVPQIETPEKEPEPERMIHGILELKPPEVDDAPFLTLTYDFSKIPHSFRLSKNYSIMEYSYYKYKPMLMKAQEFARRKMLKNALNYYRVIKSQNIPPELKKMINRNILDITEFLEKYLMSKGG